MTRLLILLFLTLVPFLNVSGQDSKQTFFVYLNTNPDKEHLSKAEVEALQSAHLANIDSLYEAGDIIAAGPFNDGGGIFVLLAKSEEQAWEIINTDPAISANRFKIELHQFDLISGNFCDYAKPVEMLKYKYLRFMPNKQMSEFESTSLKNAVRKYMSNPYTAKDVLVSGAFNDGGGLLLLKSSYAGDIIEFIEKHPYISVGEHRCNQRALWLAKGTFCD